MDTNKDRMGTNTVTFLQNSHTRAAESSASPCLFDGREVLLSYPKRASGLLVTKYKKEREVEEENKGS